MTPQELVSLVLVGLNVLCGTRAESATGTAHLFLNTTTFTIPFGSYRLRILAVGGGGGGCGGIKQGKGGSGEAAVNIVHVNGPTHINVTVGKGGKGSPGHNVEATSNGMQSRFGDYATANGGTGCTSNDITQSLHNLKGINHFRLSEITEGQKGLDSSVGPSPVQGGDRGYLINGTGPTGSQGESNNSATGGTGYGAGGGSGGAIYKDPWVYSGGDGADGVVYVELVHSVCKTPADVMFALQSLEMPDEFEHQLDFVSHVVKNFQVSQNNTRAALLTYAFKVHLKFGFNDFTNPSGLQSAISDIRSETNVSRVVRIADVYQIALITFFESFTINPNRGIASKAFVLLTYGGNFTQMELIDKYRNDMSKQEITTVVVDMGNDTSDQQLRRLVENVNNLYTEGAPDNSSGYAYSSTVPWIVDLICQDSKEVGSVQSFDVSSTRTFELTTSTTATNTHSVGIFTTTLLSGLSNVSSSYVDASTSIKMAPASTTSSVVPAMTSSLGTPTKSYKTVDELEKDLQDVLSFNVSKVNITNLQSIKQYIGLAGKLLAESQRIPNATERGIEFQLVEKVEAIGLEMAKQIKPSSEGYKAVILSSGKVEMAVASLNLTKVEQIRLPDILPHRSNETMFNLDSIQLPREAFKPNSTDVGQLVWMTFEALTAMKNKNDYRVTSRIMDVIVQPRQYGVFQEPVRMTFLVTKQSDDFKPGESYCGFWNFSRAETKKLRGEWSQEGCHLPQRNKSVVECHCNHLTSFAVLTKVNRFEVNDDHKTSLSIITYIGCSLSILGCILTICTYAFLPSLRSQRTVIHMNLAIAILLAQVCFLVAVFGVKPHDSQVACFVVAVCLFYFYLCVFTWMLVEGVHIYCMVVIVFNSGRGRKLLYLLVGWGFPLMAVTIVVSVLRMDFLSEEICWLSVETGAIWYFVGPVVFVMTVNLIILAMIMKVTAQMLSEDTSSARSLAKATATLLPILGLSWVFGLLAINKEALVFEYLFCIFNSIQGFLIFIVYCLTNSEVRREFQRKLNNMAATRNPGTASSNPSTTPKHTPVQLKCSDEEDKIVEQKYLNTKL